MKLPTLALALLAVACGPPGREHPANPPGGAPDAGTSCEVGEFSCFGRILQRCDNGTWVDQETCSTTCNPMVGCVQCQPGGPTCVGEEVHACSDKGVLGELVETCSGSARCDDGRCADVCAEAAAARSSAGCEFWAVDLHNFVDVQAMATVFGCNLFGADLKQTNLPVCLSTDALSGLAGLCDNGECADAGAGFACESASVCVMDAQSAPFAVVVSNPSQSSAATVTLQNALGTRKTVTVDPGAIQTIFPQQLGFPDQSIAWSGIESKAYRLTSDRPVVAHQFNALPTAAAFSNDASLLLPAHALDTRYHALTWATMTRRPSNQDLNGYVTVVASAPGTTSVTVTPTAAVRGGLGMTGMTGGAARTFTLEQFQTLNLEAPAGADLSGTLITASAPVAAFAGHTGAVMSSLPGGCCADHLEDQLFPTSTWGKKYAIARSLPRGGEPDRLRVVAQKAGTVVTFNPPKTCPTLGAGQFCTVDITADTEITASEPVLVAHYLLSIGQVLDEASPQGDPALAFAVPAEQFREEYDLHVPAQYTRSFFAIVAPAGGTVHLDGHDVTGELQAFGSGQHRAGRFPVDAGLHRLQCPGGCSVEVGGYGDEVSFLFAGGLNLQRIATE